MVALRPRQEALAPHLPSGERVYAIGDVHGRLDLLDQLLILIRHDNAERPAARVTLVLLGDLIDRGPASKQVVEGCQALSEQCARFVVLKGNHEAMMVDALGGNVPAFAMWMKQGGDAALKSWGVPTDLIASGAMSKLRDAALDRVSDEQLRWLGTRPLTHQVGNCLFVHAGIRPGVSLARQASTDLLWIRSEFTSGEEPLSHVVIHGHSVCESEPALRHGRFGIDTGAYRTGRLTALGLEQDRSWTIATAGPVDSVAENSVAVSVSRRPEERRDAYERNVRALLEDVPDPMRRTRRLSKRLTYTSTAGMAAAAFVVGASHWLLPSRRPAVTEVAKSISGPSPQAPRTAVATMGLPASTPLSQDRHAPIARILTRSAVANRRPEIASIARFDGSKEPERRGIDEPSARLATTGSSLPHASIGQPIPRSEKPVETFASAAPLPASEIDAVPSAETMRSIQPSSTLRLREAKLRKEAIDVIRQLRRQ